MSRGGRAVIRAATCLAILGLTTGCRPRPTTVGAAPPTAARPDRFQRVTEAAGIDFTHRDGSSGRHYFPEVMGAGCAFVDLTGDGLPDIYLVNGAPLPGAPADNTPRNRFYRNLGDGSFVDETAASGLGDSGYGLGCCAGDFNGDGLIDLYVTNLGRNALYQNNGDGSFSNVARQAGVDTPGFSTGAAFADYDGDGLLDLYVCDYVDWTPETNVTCEAPDGQRQVPVYCRPLVYPAAPNHLYRNTGKGTFSEVTAESRMTKPPGRSLGCLWADVDNDGDLDLYVANDGTANFLFINQGDGRFTEEATARGVALSESGQPQASMGVAAPDYDGDGWLDLAVTNFSGEYTALYRNVGNGHYQDVSAATGIRRLSSKYVGFGIGFPDLDLDGRPDVFIANGHVTEAGERFYAGVTLAQPNLALRNDGRGFAPFSNPGPALGEPRVSRGAAFADYDGDGDLDALVLNWRGQPDLLRNEGPERGNWLRLALASPAGRLPTIGARVQVTAGGRTAIQAVTSGGSYCSQNELILTFGLGEAKQAERVQVRWPDGRLEVWRDLAAGAGRELRRGTGDASSP